MKSYKILLAIIVGLFSSTALFAQWGFTATLRVSGKCSEVLPGMNNMSFPINGLPTESDCKLLKKTLQSIQSGFDGCKIYYVCTACIRTGSDMVGSQASSVPGKPALNGTERGQAYFTPSPGQSVQEWVSEMQQKSQTFAGNTDEWMPATGNKQFDETYAGLMDNSWGKEGENNVYPKGRSGSGANIPGIAGAITAEGNKNEESERYINGSTKKPAEQQTTESVEIEEPYKAKNGYQVMKELGESVGVDISKYMTEKEWDKPKEWAEDTKSMHSKELLEWNGKYDQFVLDVRAAQKKQEEEKLAKLNDNPGDNVWNPSNQNTSLASGATAKPLLEYGATVKRNEKPVALDLDKISMQLGKSRRAIELEIDIISAEIDKNERFINTQKLSRYKEKYIKKNTANKSKLEEYQEKLKKNLKQESEHKIKNYNQEIMANDKQLKGCVVEIQCEELKRRNNELKEQIIAENRKIKNNFNYLVDSQQEEREKQLREEYFQMSFSDKSDETTGEERENIALEKQELERKHQNHEISEQDYWDNLQYLRVQELAVSQDETISSTVRFANNTYDYIKENPKEAAITGVEFVLTAAVDYAAGVFTIPSGGLSLAGGYVLNITISTAANRLRGQDSETAQINAIYDVTFNVVGKPVGKVGGKFLPELPKTIKIGGKNIKGTSIKNLSEQAIGTAFTTAAFTKNNNDLK